MPRCVSDNADMRAYAEPASRAGPCCGGSMTELRAAPLRTGGQAVGEALLHPHVHPGHMGPTSTAPRS
ncbi:hypothetical protein DHEL01_v211296 [Diaporthe helianthi]|uniref:Uncharacterized protein n=1 Tax=Diaporthe helianthi TaxID=158607 RepID=A0A2P5HJ83_DIAHE|nr:hypothetical protein DHEL01_v211296 [Diaporthe helianthi]